MRLKQSPFDHFVCITKCFLIIPIMIAFTSQLYAESRTIGPDNFVVDPSTSLEDLFKDAEGAFSKAPASQPAVSVPAAEDSWSEPAPPPEAAPRNLPMAPTAMQSTKPATTTSAGSAEGVLPGGKIKMTGKYRLSGGATPSKLDFNNADANRNLFGLQGPTSAYVFGQDTLNTFDPEIYNQLLLNIDFSPADRINFYTQIVNDPWSLVGTTGEHKVLTDLPIGDVPSVRLNLKYWGNLDATIPETYRARDHYRFNFPSLSVNDSHTTAITLQGKDNEEKINILFPAMDIDYEYRPIRKMWVDLGDEDMKVRVFALADETQALTSDDPLGLSNHKDYWQPSPWLYQYVPLQRYEDVFGVQSISRGYYSDGLASYARDSEGNRLVLLKGASLEARNDGWTVQGTVAAPYTPWDENYFDHNNASAAVRIKKEVSERVTLGTTYTARKGYVDDKTTDEGQVGSVDIEYKINDASTVKGQFAGSFRESDLKQAIHEETDYEGYAYKLSLQSEYDHAKWDGHSATEFSFTHMDKDFEPLLSTYHSTRDDKFWGTHLRFEERPDIEPFRIGDGIDVNRFVFRFHWKEKLFKERFYNLFDARNVHKAHNTAYVETVIRDEVTYKINSQLTAKGLFRWRGLPRTTPGIEPGLTAFYFPKDDVDQNDFFIRNTAVEGGKRADQFTYSVGLQYEINPRWAVEGIGERTNLIPDFPRGLLVDFSRDPNERVEALQIERMVPFLYGQNALKAVPPYPYYNIFKERIIYRPAEDLKFVLHATQNTYKFATGIDDNITHVGLSAEFKLSKKLSLFSDYTYSRQSAVHELVALNGPTGDYNGVPVEYKGHHNFYVSGDYQINPETIFRMEYGVFGLGSISDAYDPYSVSTFYLPTVDTEHLFRAYLIGEF